jgi:flagellar protein FliL
VKLMSEAKLKDKKIKIENKGNIFRVIIIVLIAVVMIGGSFFAGVMTDKLILSNMNNKTTGEAQNKIDETMFSLDEILVNLADESGRKYLKINICLGYEEDKELVAELQKRKDIIKDAVITILRLKKAEDLDGPGTDKLKKELLESVNSLIEKGKITNIYFPDLLIQ